MSTTTFPFEHWPPSELVSSQWVNEHLHDNNVKIVEVVYDSKTKSSYNSKQRTTVIDWHEDIDHSDYEDTQRQNEKYDKLLKKIGISDENTTIVLCSDFNNWFASIVYWILKHFGNNNVKLLEGGGGGRQEWLNKN